MKPVDQMTLAEFERAKHGPFHVYGPDREEEIIEYMKKENAIVHARLDEIARQIASIRRDAKRDPDWKRQAFYTMGGDPIAGAQRLTATDRAELEKIAAEAAAKAPGSFSRRVLDEMKSAIRGGDVAERIRTRPAGPHRLKR